MKTRIASLIFVTLVLTGCVHNFPKDAYGQGVKSTVNTPWGPSTLEVEILATGTAAKNISLPETPSEPKKK
jgi:PBP1b-binding outer membrane lipoprotein LpoB